MIQLAGNTPSYLTQVSDSEMLGIHELNERNVGNKRCDVGNKCLRNVGSTWPNVQANERIMIQYQLWDVSDLTQNIWNRSKIFTPESIASQIIRQGYGPVCEVRPCWLWISWGHRVWIVRPYLIVRQPANVRFGYSHCAHAVFDCADGGGLCVFDCRWRQQKCGRMNGISVNKLIDWPSACTRNKRFQGTLRLTEVPARSQIGHFKNLSSLPS